MQGEEYESGSDATVNGGNVTLHRSKDKLLGEKDLGDRTCNTNESVSDWSENDESDADSIISVGVTRKEKGRRGPRSAWNEKYMQSLVDIILKEETYKNELITSISKKNIHIYEKIIEALKEIHPELVITPIQTRNKFKRMKIQTRAYFTNGQPKGDNQPVPPWLLSLLPHVASEDPLVKNKFKPYNNNISMQRDPTQPTTSCTDTNTIEKVEDSGDVSTGVSDVDTSDEEGSKKISSKRGRKTSWNIKWENTIVNIAASKEKYRFNLIQNGGISKRTYYLYQQLLDEICIKHPSFDKSFEQLRTKFKRMKSEAKKFHQTKKFPYPKPQWVPKLLPLLLDVTMKRPTTLEDHSLLANSTTNIN